MMFFRNILVLVAMVLFLANCAISKTEKKQLLARITATEDKLEILNLLAGSAISSDVASEAYWKQMFSQDAVMDRGQNRLDKGQENILKIVNGTDQKEAIKYGMSHLGVLPHIILKGDGAVATGYLLVIVPDANASHVTLPGKGVSSGFSIYQITVNRWQLAKTNMGWKVTHRSVRPLSSADSQAILKQAIEGDLKD
jgi:hypothetical protein